MEPHNYDFILVGPSYSKFDDYLSKKNINALNLVHSYGEPELINHKYATADLTSRESARYAVDRLAIAAEGVSSMYEPYVMAAAWLAEILGLPGTSIKSAENCSDKLLMRRAFDKSPLQISASYAAVNSWGEIEEFARNTGFPVMLKPRGLQKSLLVSKNDDISQLRQSYDDAIGIVGHVYERYAPGKEPGFIVEEYLDGSHHTVQAIIDSEGSATMLDVVDLIPASKAGFDDSFVLARSIPSTLPNKLQQAIADVSAHATELLELKSCLAHCELVLTDKGPRILEIGARIGGYRREMYQSTGGLDLYDLMLDTARGNETDFSYTRHKAVSVLELFPRQSGYFKEFKGLEDINGLKSLKTFRKKIEPGQKTGKASEGFKAAAIVILEHADPSIVSSERGIIKENVQVLVD